MSERTYNDDDFELDDPELSPAMQAQLERLERTGYRGAHPFETKREKLKVRRDIEEWAEARKMRRDIDYLH